MLKQLLSLNEPDRTIKLEALPASKAFKIYSPKEFKTRFCGKLETVEKGENLCAKSFALHLLAKYPDITEEADVEEVKIPESYEEKLVSIKGIGPASAKKIMAKYPTSAELMEAVKAGRLPEDWISFKEDLQEVF